MSDLVDRERVLRKIERVLNGFQDVLDRGVRPTLFLPKPSAGDVDILELRVTGKSSNARRFLFIALLLVRIYELVKANVHTTRKVVFEEFKYLYVDRANLTRSINFVARMLQESRECFHIRFEEMRKVKVNDCPDRLILSLWRREADWFGGVMVERKRGTKIRTSMPGIGTRRRTTNKAISSKIATDCVDRDRVLKKIEEVFKGFQEMLKVGVRPTLFLPESAVGNVEMLELRIIGTAYTNSQKFLLVIQLLVRIYELLKTNSYATKESIFEEFKDLYVNQVSLDRSLNFATHLLQESRSVLHVGREETCEINERPSRLFLSLKRQGARWVGGVVERKDGGVANSPERIITSEK